MASFLTVQGIAKFVVFSQNNKQSSGGDSEVRVEEAVEQCRQSGLVGIELIEYAQRLVCLNIKYSFTNSFDLPSKAFKKGYGYCWQQASVLNLILKKLGFESKIVYSTQNIFPESLYNGVVLKEHISGHAWCKVRYGGKEGDVCPGNIDNRFGKLHFKPRSKIRKWNVFVCFFSYWGSAVVNYKRFAEIKRLMGEH
jgi:hypothetical protein